MRVLEPLQSVITADGELKRGMVEIEGQTLRVECAVDGSWVYLYDDDNAQYDLLTYNEDGALRSTGPTLTTEWTEEHFSWLQALILQPEPVQFVRRPHHGFAPPTPAPEDQTPKPRKQRKQQETPNKTKLAAILFVSLFYLVFGFLASQSESTILWFCGGFMLLAAFRGFYECRKLFY